MSDMMSTGFSVYLLSHSDRNPDLQPSGDEYEDVDEEDGGTGST
jgi:hypothetical protein